MLIIPLVILVILAVTGLLLVLLQFVYRTRLPGVFWRLFLLFGLAQVLFVLSDLVPLYALGHFLSQEWRIAKLVALTLIAIYVGYSMLKVFSKCKRETE